MRQVVKKNQLIDPSLSVYNRVGGTCTQSSDIVNSFVYQFV